MPILNYTTSVAAEKSAADISSKLVKAGASRISTQYEQGQPTGIQFIIETQFGPRIFVLPADAGGVYQALCQGKNRAEARYRTREQAQRVAWRILKDWIEVQLAVIESGLTTIDTVMLPYMIDPDTSQSVAEFYQERGRRALEGASA